MADILIRGADVPLNGKHPACLIFENGEAKIVVEYSVSYSERSVKVFPLIALPEGHGRLIDAGKLMKHYAWWGENDEQRELFDEIIDQQETVVPAEEEEE